MVPLQASQLKGRTNSLAWVDSDLFIKPARKPQAFKPGDEWRPERSGGDPAKPGSLKETLDFSPGSFICYKRNPEQGLLMC
jgi:hypothetical protein